ncbi:MAG TPA: XRE family transcriptional regulator [Gemmatimonadaceae bacterium]|nr:XRE family transcriptional regulator [Gemmatimonadaceae bacterium]
MPKAKKKRTSTRAALAKDSIPRAALGRELQRRITTFGLSRDSAARIVDDAASQMSRLMTGHIEEFSADRLVKMLLRLGTDVDITLRHAGRLGKRGRVRIHSATKRG